MCECEREKERQGSTSDVHGNGERQTRVHLVPVWGLGLRFEVSCFLFRVSGLEFGVDQPVHRLEAWFRDRCLHEVNLVAERVEQG